MRNKQYWIDRANRRMDSYTLSAIEQSKVINKAYNRTKTYVEAEIAKILKHTGGEDTFAYEYRMKRLNALLKNTEEKMKELYGINVSDTTAFLKSIIPEAYYHTIFDIAQGVGEQPVFAAVNDKLINAIVKEPWSGENYSKRIWKNTNKLADDVRGVLTEAAMSGESIYKTSRKLSDAFDTSAYNSQRLIRTETTYACNQAEMASYEALDIDKYRFVATLDTRTSPICQKLDGEVFDTKDAQAGKNLPAMHPNCRSTTIPYFEEGMPEERIARDKDGKRIKVPADMKYDDWYKQYIEPEGPPKPGKGNTPPPTQKPPEKPQTKPEQPKPVDVEIPPPEQKKPEYVDTPIPEKPVEVPKPETRPAEEPEKPKAIKTRADAEEYFGDVFSSVEKNVSALDEQLVIENAIQLQKLNERFKVLNEETYGYISGSNVKAVAQTSTRLDRNEYNLTLSSKYYKKYEDLIEFEKEAQKIFYSMPTAKEYMSVSTITHEYGHILEAEIIKNRIPAETMAKVRKLKAENKVKEANKILKLEESKHGRAIFNEIVGIAKENNKDFSLKKNLSQYGYTNVFEAFAEIFTNSQCGAPNEIGKAMQIWLKKRGY
jgi:SPP1 gp7 family putative phage head morphogenesis protein